MTDINKALIAHLKTSLPGVGVFAGTIPEKNPVPAVALYNVAFANDRDLSGGKTKRWSTWRLTVVDTVGHLQTTLDQILLLDNTGNQIFQKLFFELTLIEPKAPTEPHQRAFIDIRVYLK
jgi:hypothetical protein